MPSENFLLMMCNDYPVYLRALDCRRDPGACNDKQYNVELIKKIAGEYKGQIRDKVLAVRMRAAIANCRSYDEWMLYKDAYPRYINALPDRKLAATLDSLLATMGNRLAKTAIGKPAPSFTVTDSTGKTYTLADFKGKVVYIDLWASWCAPCRELTPHLTKLYDQLKNDNRIACISIAVMDRLPVWKTALGHDQPAWLQLFDNNGAVQKAYVANSIPKFILIDKQGNIVNLDAPMPDDASIMGLLKQEMEK
jgi:thiol-disulfide isomerase/thioredoxin